MTGDPGPATAVVRRVLPAPPEAVDDEWLDAEGLTRRRGGPAAAYRDE